MKTMTTSPHTGADRATANNALADMEEPIHDMWGLIRTLKIMSRGMVDKKFEEHDADAFLAVIEAMTLLFDVVDGNHQVALNLTLENPRREYVAEAA
jgi:hypothetical protein